MADQGAPPPAASMDSTDINGEDLRAAVRLLLRRGELAEAERRCRESLRHSPEDVAAQAALALVLHAGGLSVVAASLLDRAVASRPDDSSLQRDRANVLFALGRLQEAEKAYGGIIRIHGERCADLIGLAAVQRTLGQLTESVQTLARALELEPDSYRARGSLGLTRLLCGEPKAAVEVLREAVSLVPHPDESDFVQLRSSMIFSLNYLTETTPEAILAEARAWGEQLSRPRQDPEAGRQYATKRLDRALRIGYLSGDLCEHPVGRILAALFPHHDREAFKIFCYSNRPGTDAVTHSLRRYASAWQNVFFMSDEQVAAKIRADEIDILVDLAGHTAHSRLPVMARRPAPVQAMWLGYFGTTGLADVDYIIGDRFVLPEGCEGEYVERLARLPHSFLLAPSCARDGDRGSKAERPGRSERPFTFGSSNNLAKISDEVIECWARILRRAPGTRLLLKHIGLADSHVRERTMARFHGRGADPSRLTLLGPTGLKEHLDTYDEIDVALDTFPYTGGMTTVDALLAGVPVVTRVGDRFVGRMGLSALSSAGLDDLVTWSDDEYADLAVALATDAERLDRVRGAVRSRVPASPLCDAEMFTRNLEALLRDLWLGRAHGL